MEPEISVITIAELEAGVLAAADPETRAHRLATLIRAGTQDPLLIDARVASAGARLRVHQAQARRRLNIDDLWIAATAVVHRLPVIAQDDVYDALVGVAGLQVLKI